MNEIELPEPHPLRGYYGIGISHAKAEENIGTLLRSAASFRAAFVFTIGRRYRQQASDTTKAWRHIPLFHFEDFEQMRDAMPFQCRLVGVELDERAVKLPAYEHPARAIYLLGAEDHGLTTDERERCHDLVEIPGASHCLNVATAGTVVLYDRWNKKVKL